jgi:L-asparaginase II
MKKRKEPKGYWRIRGYDSMTEIFDQSVPIGQMTEGNMKELLRVLVAKDLSPRKLIGAYAKRGTRISNGFLEIRKENQLEKRRAIYTCGQNPHYIATTEICDI